MRQDAGIGGSERQHTLPVEDNYGFEPHGGSFFAFCPLLMTIDKKHLSIVAKFTTSIIIYLFYLSIADYIIYLMFILLQYNIIYALLIDSIDIQQT